MLRRGVRLSLVSTRCVGRQNLELLFVVDDENIRRMLPSPPAQAAEVGTTSSTAGVMIFAGPESVPALI
jgi:hypothetical protein